MALAQQRADLLLGIDHVFPGSHFDRDGLDRTHVRLADPEDLFLGRRERDQDDPAEGVGLPKRLSVAVWPGSATLVAPPSGMIGRPSATGHSRASR